MNDPLPQNVSAKVGKRQGGDRVYNVVAKVLGWGGDGSAKVEIMVDVGPLRTGSEMNAAVANDPKRRFQLDFAYRRAKQGLRVGGMVLLRKSVIDDNGLCCKELDILSSSPKEGPCVILRNSAVWIHPPETATSMMANRVSLAKTGDAVRVSSFKEASEAAIAFVEECSMFGTPTLILTGLDDDDDICEIAVSFAVRKPTSEEVVEAVRTRLDLDTERLMKDGSRRWHIVPVIDLDVIIDVNRQSKVSAQYLNIDYKSAEEPEWTRTNAVLKGTFEEWFLADATPVSEPDAVTPCLLFDLL